MSEWIDVNEKPIPETKDDDINYLIIGNKETTIPVFNIDGCLVTFNGIPIDRDTITHFMMSPEPPK